jgi:hypothetical protein
MTAPATHRAGASWLDRLTMRQGFSQPLVLSLSKDELQP